ncbi:hypothetical protein [Brevibacillus dissolubilis]|uniref:hypothetical protein n=1 Tax=Brevibacillus dissolubilis TaxID=1844116 RepID=UPI001116D13F|nr:hypothetical protein [Brevibacillus dissolubilis]
MFNLFHSRSHVSRGNKGLPIGTFIIVTKDNQEELRPIMQYLTQHAIFRVEGTNVVILDCYSYDKTVEVAETYVSRFPDKVRLLKKDPEKTIVECVLPYLSPEYVEIINLTQMFSERHHLPPDKFPGWVEKLSGTMQKHKSAPIDERKLVERLEEDRRIIFEELRNQAIEPLAHIEMRLGNAEEKMMSVDEIQHLVMKMQRRLSHLVTHFDPYRYVGDSLFPCMTSLVEEYSARTQITYHLKESGKERPLPHYFGLSIIRMVQEILDTIQQQAEANEVEIRLRWNSKRIYLQVRENGQRKNQSATTTRSSRFIDERAMILGGTYELKASNSKTDHRITLPLPKETGDS